VIIQCDVNGWTYEILDQNNAAVQTLSAPYASRTD